MVNPKRPLTFTPAMICGRCGAPIEPYTLTDRWNRRPAGTIVYIRVTPHPKDPPSQGRAVCDFVPEVWNRPYETWQLHDPFGRPHLEFVMEDLRDIGESLR